MASKLSSSICPLLFLNPPACEIHLNPFFFTVHSSSKQGVCRMSSFCSSNLPEEASVKADEQGSQAMAWIRIRLNLSKNRIASLLKKVENIPLRKSTGGR